MLSVLVRQAPRMRLASEITFEKSYMVMGQNICRRDSVEMASEPIRVVFVLFAHPDAKTMWAVHTFSVWPHR